MAILGTHDSVTGEKGYGFINLFKYFGQTQKLSIIDQAKSGIGYFDIRVRRTERGWVCAHGLWETKKTFQQILKEISENSCLETVLLGITYEGTLPEDLSETSFVKFIKKTIKKYENITILSISEKYKKISWKKKVWNSIWTKTSKYKIIGHYPHFSLTPFPPIPSLWKYEKPVLPEENDTIVIVDFFEP